MAVRVITLQRDGSGDLLSQVIGRIGRRRQHHDRRQRLTLIARQLHVPFVPRPQIAGVQKHWNVRMKKIAEFPCTLGIATRMRNKKSVAQCVNASLAAGMRRMVS